MNDAISIAQEMQDKQCDINDPKKEVEYLARCIQKARMEGVEWTLDKILSRNELSPIIDVWMRDEAHEAFGECK